MRIQRSERPRGPSRRARIILGVVAAALFVLVMSLRGIAGFYTDYLWFDEVGFTEVWSGLLAARIVPALVFTAVFFVILLVNLIVADRLAPRFTPVGPEEQFVERYREAIGPYAGRVRVAVAAVFALIAGAGVSGRWHDWLLFRNSIDFGVEDPQFHRDIGFYVFKLPFMKFLFEWTFTSLIIVVIIVAVAHYLNGGIRARGPQGRVTPAVKVHISVLLAVIALVRLFGYWLERFELNFSTRGAVHGASYTDVNAQLPALNMLMVISAAAAVLFLVNIRRRGWGLPVLAVGLWAFLSLVIGQIYPAFIQRFRVEPNELQRESAFIDRNIAATREAFGIGDVEINEYPYSGELESSDLAENEATLGNARLWDPVHIEDTYKQLQRIRNFYEFNDVDVDRYMVDGTLTQTLVSARELDIARLPSSTWVNRHLVFTHGYGLVMSPANAVGDNGEPEFLIEDIPTASEHFDIERPEIYYGETIPGFAIVDTRDDEFNFPKEGGGQATTRYDGRGGVELSNVMRRAAFFLRFWDFRFMVSGQLTSDSRVLFLREIQRRVEKAAPFLRFDADPYPVLIDGKVLWVVDGYTTTDRYPYAQAVVPDGLREGSGLDTRLNYVRNPVKATVDAYDGTVTFYVIDAEDPLLRAYRKAFPDLFTNQAEMPAELRAHFRYPEDLFRVQADLFSTYHVREARAFYNRSDQWQIARDPGSGQLQAPTGATGGTTRTTSTAGGRPLSESQERGAPMAPYYLLMRLPGEEREEFLVLQPFTPPSRDNLLAFMTAKSDPNEYGRLQAFVMPTDRQVFGPRQVDAQINATEGISERLTLLNQQGSRVIKGNLQVIPLGDSLLYVRPVYIEATGDVQFPQLQFVIAFHDGDAVMAPTLQEALAGLFEGFQAPAEPEAPAEPGDEPDVIETVEALLAQAATAFEEAQAALAAGDLGAYQEAVDRTGDLIARARALAGGGSSTTTTTTTTTAPPTA